MRLRLSVVIAVLLAAAPVWAHHGSTGFDQKKPVHFTGKVSGLDWSNPHIVIHVDVAGSDGKVATWLVNARPPNVAIREGFSKNSFAVGTEITVDGYQALDGSNHVNGTNLVLGDGQKIVIPDCFKADGPFCYKPYDQSKGKRIE
jgi:Family of unknown function (DUF6152)